MAYHRDPIKGLIGLAFFYYPGSGKIFLRVCGTATDLNLGYLKLHRH